MRFLIFSEQNTSKKSVMTMILIYLVVGIVLLLFPAVTSKIISFIFAGVILIYGALKVYNYFKIDAGERLFFDKIDLGAGFVSIILGLFLAINTKIVFSILPFLVGAYLVFNSICSIMASFHLKKLGHTTWGSSFALSFVLTILGIVLLLNPFRAHILLVRFIGISLIVNAISDIWVMIQTHKMLK